MKSPQDVLSVVDSDLPASPPDNGVAFGERRLRAPRTASRERASRKGAIFFSAVVLLLSAATTFLLASLALSWPWAAAIAVLCGVLCMLSVHIASEWERAVVLRFGKLARIDGPGLFFTIPVAEYVTLRVDQRMRCTFFRGEQILTADLVPVDVNAVFYWSVWDTRKACTEVEDFLYSVSNAAQACMRDVIGSMDMEEMATRRQQIDREIRDEIAALTEQWGISVATVKIRDIIVPENLQQSLSKTAQAQRERDARIILAEVEKDISSMLVEAAHVYDENEHALQLRAMHAVSDGIKDGGMVVVPNALGDSFGNAADFLKRL